MTVAPVIAEVSIIVVVVGAEVTELVVAVVVDLYRGQSRTAHKQRNVKKYERNIGDMKQLLILTRQSHTKLFITFIAVLHNHFRESLILRGEWGVMDGMMIEHIQDSKIHKNHWICLY